MTMLSSPPDDELALDQGGRLTRAWLRWVSRVTRILRGGEPLRVASYKVATLPPAAAWSRCVVVVTDETGGETLAVSDGTDWRRVTDLAVVA